MEYTSIDPLLFTICYYLLEIIYIYIYILVDEIMEVSRQLKNNLFISQK